MELIALTPMLRVSDVKATLDFYRSVLRFECIAYNDEWQWATLSKDKVQLMIAAPSPQDRINGFTFTGSFYFKLDTGIDRLWQELKDNVQVCYAIESFSYGMREFGIYDNNGYLLQFGEDIVQKRYKKTPAGNRCFSTD